MGTADLLRGTGTTARGRGGTRRTDVCSYIGVLLAYLVGMQCLPVGLREGGHLQGQRGVSPALGPLGKVRQPPALLPHPHEWGKRGESRVSRGSGCTRQLAWPGRHRQRSGGSGSCRQCGMSERELSPWPCLVAGMKAQPPSPFPALVPIGWVSRWNWADTTSPQDAKSRVKEMPHESLTTECTTATISRAGKQRQRD